MNNILALFRRGRRNRRGGGDFRSSGEDRHRAEQGTEEKNLNQSHRFEVGQHPPCYVQRRQSTEAGLLSAPNSPANPFLNPSPNDIISGGLSPDMHSSRLNWLSVGFLVGAFLFAAVWLGFERKAPRPISPNELVQAMDAHQDAIVDRYFRQRENPNARVANDRSLLFTAVLREERRTAHRLLDAGASGDLTDDAGVTPLMVGAMHGDLEMVCALIGHVTDLTDRDRAGHTAL